MAVKDGNIRLSITMKKDNADALDYMSKSMSITKASILNLALYDFIKKNFPEIKVDGEYTIKKI
jgi:hypothetical protein